MSGSRLGSPAIALLFSLLAPACEQHGGEPSVASRPHAAPDGAAFRALTRRINRETGARQMSPGELARLLEEGERVILLDTREPEEHAVSSLPGARLVPPGDMDELEIADELMREDGMRKGGTPEDVTIVTYCTAGYRSGLAAVELEKRLGRPVFNLDGGIIGWFNEGGEVKDPSGRPVDEIHPYSDEWARFVKTRRQRGEDENDSKASADGKEPER